MKRILIFSIVLILAINSNAQQTGSFTDSRDGKTYKTVKIGYQVWMAEDLKYSPSSGKYWTYDNGYSTGYLYNWKTASSACPTGWHLPSSDEWDVLINYVGKYNGQKLKSYKGWMSDRGKKYTDEYNFSAEGGARVLVNTNYVYNKEIGQSTHWWTSSVSWNGMPFSIWLFYGDENIHIDKYNEGFGYSVRCIRD